MEFNPRSQYAQYNRYFQKIKEAYSQRVEIRESLEILLSLLTISILVIFALRPTFNTIAELFAQLQSQQEVKKTLDEKITSLQRAQDLWAQETFRVSLIDDALPKNPTPQAFLRQVEGLTGKHSLSLKVFSAEDVLLVGKASDLQTAQKVVPAEDAQTFPNTKLMSFSLNVAGPFVQVLNFLTEFENLRQQIIIENFAMSLSPSSEVKDVSLRITGQVVYFSKEN